MTQDSKRGIPLANWLGRKEAPIVSPGQVTPEDRRLSLKLSLAGGLAFILLLISASVISWHCWMIGSLVSSMSQVKDDKELAKFDKAISVVNETAKGIYAVIIPIAASAGTYFFAAKPRD